MYGSGENTGQCIISGSEWLSRPGSVGRGFETDIRIRGVDGAPLTPGETGEILMRPHDPGGRSEYIGPDAPAPDRDAEGFQSIGDMGWLDEDGYLHLAGRLDDVINTGGVKIHPEAVEAVLLEHPDVTDAIVSGVPDREWGERVVARIVCRDGNMVPPADLPAFCATRLEPAETPKTFEVVASLPRDGFGKIRRKTLQNS